MIKKNFKVALWGAMFICAASVRAEDSQYKIFFADPEEDAVNQAEIMDFMGETQCSSARFIANSKDQIVLEAESVPIRGNWRFVNTHVKKFFGEGFLAFVSSEKPNGGGFSYDGKSELQYPIRIRKSGTYNVQMLGLRYDPGLKYRVCNSHDTQCCPASARDCTRSDLNNDVFLGFNSIKPEKAFLALGKSKNKWLRGGNFDKNGSRPAVKVKLSAGDHTLKIRGRSNLFGLDRIYIYRSDRPKNNSRATPLRCVVP